MKKSFLLFFIIIPLFFINAQNTKKLNYFETILYDAEILLVDGASFYTYPLRMNESEWLLAGGIGIGTYLLIRNDDHIRKRIGTEVDRYDNNFWRVIESSGVVQYAEIAGAATYAVGLFSKNNDVRVLGRMLVQSLTYSGLTAMFIRMIAGRKRPSLTDDPTDFIGFTSNNSFQSFPSGHVTVAFAFSTVLAEYFDSPWSRIAFYGLAGLSATERLINSQHWFADVTLGALVGIAGGIHVINEESKRSNGEKSRLTIQPTFNGISFKYRLN
jgi:membrane-associated phospholipid phosphatase